MKKPKAIEDSSVILWLTSSKYSKIRQFSMKIQILRWSSNRIFMGPALIVRTIRNSGILISISPCPSWKAKRDI